MKVKRIADQEPPGAEATVTLTVSGNVLEVRHCLRLPPGIAIEKLNADQYVDKRTGEVKDFVHNSTRADDPISVKQSLKRLRDLINANLTDPQTALWVTLTYAENMTDSAKLYQDFRRFWQRFKYYLDKNKLPHAEYIAAAEPQGRGAWHLHCLFLFSKTAPYIPNAEIARIWGHGFTKVKGLSGIDNPGLYLTAYLGDLELTEAIDLKSTAGRLKKTSDCAGARKAVIKGARLKLYPPGFNLFRHSRGIILPERHQMTEAQAQKIINGAPLVYEKTVALLGNDGETINIIHYRHYNRSRMKQTCMPKTNQKGGG